jgi:hypothetical protein
MIQDSLPPSPLTTSSYLSYSLLQRRLATTYLVDPGTYGFARKKSGSAVTFTLNLASARTEGWRPTTFGRLINFGGYTTRICATLSLARSGLIPVDGSNSGILPAASLALRISAVSPAKLANIGIARFDGLLEYESGLCARICIH